jgi:hypothetical protein
MNLKSLMRSAVVGSAFALLAGAPIVAAAADMADADESMTAVSDADELNEMLEANNVDTGAQGDTNEDVNSGTNDEASSDSTAESTMAGSSSEATQAQQDATEATQEGEQDKGSTPPG